jgi:ABC-type uncharacterized transport system substrate-binding protein
MDINRITQNSRMHTRVIYIVGLALLVVLMPILVSAHPHNWIDLRVEVRFDQSGLATGLYQRWLFDDYYSIAVTEGMDENGDGKPDQPRLAELRNKVFGNLKAYNFFTNVEYDGKEVLCGAVSQKAMAMQGNRLEMSFYIPFDSPHDLRSAPLTYRIFDPSYYIEMLYAEAKDAIVMHNPPDGCMYNLEPPHPDPKKIAYAASLPVGKNGENDLGQFFAEKVTIECTNTD